jgi:hypothetical protein
MMFRSFGLALGLALLAAACGGESSQAPASQSAGASEATTEPSSTETPAASLVAQGDALAAKAEAEKAAAQEAAAQKAAAQKAAAEQAAAAKAAAQKAGADQKTQVAQQKNASSGLTAEQERKRQAILDQKAAIKSGKGAAGSYEGPAGEGPRLTFTRSQLNFGKVWDTDTLTGEFEFKNTGKSKLVFDLVKASCGCTTTELDRMEFEPGEGSTIKVEWHPKGFGPQIKTITVTSNDEQEQYKRVMIQADIMPFAKFDPEPTRFDSVKIFEEHRTKTTLTCVDPNFELVSLTSSNPHLTAVEGQRQPNGDLWIELVLDDTTPWGMFNASVTAKVRGVRSAGEEPMERDAILHVGASIFGDLEVTPNLFSVGRVAPGGRISFSVVLKSAENKPFQLTRAEVLNSQPPGMTLRGEPNPGGGLRVFVEGDVGDYEGLIRGTAVLETDLEGEGERRLPVIGIVRP